GSVLVELRRPVSAKAQRGRQRRDEARWFFLGRRRLTDHVSAQARLSELQDAPGREPAKFLVEAGTEVAASVLERLVAAVVGEALGNDEACLLRRTRLDERHRSRLLDAVDVGLGQRFAHLAVEVAKAGDEHDRGRHAVGELDQVTRSLLEALLVVLEK